VPAEPLDELRVKGRSGAVDAYLVSDSARA
jgi:hypothetical protein